MLLHAETCVLTQITCPRADFEVRMAAPLGVPALGVLARGEVPLPLLTHSTLSVLGEQPQWMVSGRLWATPQQWFAACCLHVQSAARSDYHN